MHALIAAYAALIIFGGSCLAAKPDIGERPGILAIADGLPTPILSRIELSGFTRVTKRAVSVSASRTNGATQVSNVRDGKILSQITLNDGEFPFLDLDTGKLGADESGLVQISFKYGDKRRECFVNDDGRNVAKILFPQNSEPRKHITSYEGCAGDTSK
jgi:hypothetical protein